MPDTKKCRYCYAMASFSQGKETDTNDVGLGVLGNKVLKLENRPSPSL